MRTAGEVMICLVLLGACTSDEATQNRLAPDSSIPADGGANDSGQTGEMPAVSCDVELPRACVEPKPSYADVSPILEDRCVICHAGMAGGPWPLTTYGHVADWQNEIRDHVARCTMPPPDSGVAISDDERSRILMWLRCGLAR